VHRYFPLAILLALAAASLAESPFNFDQTPGKLPKDIVPERYDIGIAPSIESASFTGAVTISLNVRKPVKQLVLNSLGLKILKATLVANGEIPLTPQLDEKEQLLTFPLPKELPSGSAKLTIIYTGKLSETPEGLFITRYATAGGEKRALMTQFQATDARRMFPCWDEPVFRARFRLAATVPSNWLPISNMPEESSRDVGKGLKIVTFAESPSMVSYLVAFAAGELESIEGEVDGIKLRVITTEGKSEQARYALEATKQILPFYNEYFGTKYPLPKLDQVSFASTGASGMENWGAIIYNDLAFLYDPKLSTQYTKERVYEVVAHEIAHQWFGDLVTMAWWDNIWLNEGFASWMATKTTDRFNPDWDTWLRAANDKERAMQLDGRASTHPVQQRIENEAQAGDAFDQITYQKGQSFIRMLEAWLGEEAFREGIRGYMKQHRYSNTTTADLWAALAKSSGQPVSEMARGWTEQPGFPLVNVASGSGGVQITQERFRIGASKVPPLTWRVPVRFGMPDDPKSSAVRLLGPDPLDAPFTGGVLKANLGDTGYYRVRYDPPLFEPLVAKVSTLPEADRLNLLNDTWALVQAGSESISTYLNLAKQLVNDPSLTVAQNIVDRLWDIDRFARDAGKAGNFRTWTRSFLQPRLKELGWDVKPRESPLAPLLRTNVIGLLAEAGDDAVKAEARARFERFLKDPATLTGDLRACVLSIVGRDADENTYARLHDLARKETSTEQKQFLYDALASSQNSKFAEKTLGLSITNELIPKAATSLVLRVGEQHPKLAWDFAKPNLETLFAKLSSIRANDYVPNIFRKFTDAERADELEAFAKASLPPDAGPMVARGAEEIRQNSELKTRIMPEIDTWCRQQVAP
jgi:aminopeptidase N